jgi:histidinol-phosphate aminotransferase
MSDAGVSGLGTRDSGIERRVPSPDHLAVRPPGRAALRDIVAYESDRVPVPVELHDNANHFGAPPSALRVVREATAEDLFGYPGVHSRRAREAVAAYAGVSAEDVVTGCGSDDVLDCAFRALAEPGERVAYADPTFSIIPDFIRMNGLVPVPVPFRGDLDLDADALLATDARVIYLCTPNNPTGVEASRAAVERVLERAPGIVVLDEAYAEFASNRYMALAPGHGGLVVTRTLSKAFGMAGLRFGYAAAAAPLVAEMRKVRNPYSVTALAERAAIAALTSDVEWMRGTVREIVANRERLAAALVARGLRPLPSAANFVLVPIAGAIAIGRRMRELGVAVRAVAALGSGIGDALRISVGRWEEIEACLSALDAALAAVPASPSTDHR